MTPVIRNLIIANASIFLGLLILHALGTGTEVERALGLVPARFWRGWLWQPATYIWLHGGLLHLLFNMLFLWMLGSAIEEQWGPRAFFRYYLVCGIGAGLCVAVAGFGDVAPTIGASGAVFGIMLAYAVLFPDNILMVFLIFPMRARYAMMLFAGVELYILLVGGRNAGGVSQVAHLGGAAVGYLYLRYEHRVAIWWYGREARRNRRAEMRKEAEEADWQSYVAAELDPILDKISREGMHTLTEEEKRILKSAKGRSPRRRDE